MNTERIELNKEYFLSLPKYEDRKGVVGEMFLLEKTMLQYQENRNIFVGEIVESTDPEEQFEFSIDVVPVVVTE